MSAASRPTNKDIPMTPIDTEKRRFNRIDFFADALLTQGERTWPCQLLDLSLKGALITTPDNLQAEIGEVFLLELVLDSKEAVSIQMQVSVSHIENDHIGFRCDHIDLDSITHLRRLVELNLGDAELLDRDLTALSK